MKILVNITIVAICLALVQAVEDDASKNSTSGNQSVSPKEIDSFQPID